MKKLALILAGIFLTSNSAFASFTNFPAFGICTATNVRIREDPDTSNSTRVVGRLDGSERVIILSQTSIDGESWYEIDMSLKNFTNDSVDDSEKVETAWVFGNFITPLYDDERLQENIMKLLLHLNQNHANNPNAKFKSGWLTSLRISKGDIMAKALRIGDSITTLTNFLGKPDRRNNEKYIYRADDNTSLSFTIRNGKISGFNLESRI